MCPDPSAVHWYIYERAFTATADCVCAFATELSQRKRSGEEGKRVSEAGIYANTRCSRGQRGDTRTKLQSCTRLCWRGCMYGHWRCAPLPLHQALASIFSMSSLQGQHQGSRRTLAFHTFHIEPILAPAPESVLIDAKRNDAIDRILPIVVCLVCLGCSHIREGGLNVADGNAAVRYKAPHVSSL